jgi:POT family proton-dependent oligopeptide transporter
MLQIISYVVFTILILLIAKTYLDKKGHPKGLFYLFFAEMWERFSFYGMRALLTLYLIKDYYSHLENNEEVAYGIYAAYGALVYLTPLIGGYLADKFIGYRKSIIYGGVLMALGHFFMAFPTDFFFYGALGLLIMGNGFFKPNISTLVGSLYEEGDIKRDGGFTIFYMGINLGAMIAPLFCGYLGEVYGWHYGFGAAGIGMLAGLVVFWKGISSNVLGDKGLQPKEYINKKISGISVANLIYILGFVAVPVFAYLIVLDTQSSVLGDVLSVVGAVVLIYLAYIIYDYKVKQNDKVSGDRLIAILILSVFLTIFWACFEQAGSSVTVWIDKCVNLVGMTASQTNAINPFYIVLLAIPFSLLWTKLGAMNKNPNTPIKFALGIFQLGLGFLIFAATAHFIGDNGKVPFLFVFLGYFLITTGELFLSPIGLSKVTELSPKKMVAFMMGVWFLSSTFAHYISGILAKLTTTGSSAESNWLSNLGNWFMGNPDISSESVATLMQYNSIYAQIGFVTIFISIFVMLISPFIKKLMHGVH